MAYLVLPDITAADAVGGINSVGSDLVSCVSASEEE
jgi:hypothetical protein